MTSSAYITCECGRKINVNEKHLEFLKELQLHEYGEQTVNDLIEQWEEGS